MENHNFVCNQVYKFNFLQKKVSIIPFSLLIHLGGQSGIACYINTEGAFPLKRLNQIAESFKAKHSIPGSFHLLFNLYSLESQDVTSNVLLIGAPTLDTLFDILNVKLPQLLQVIDN